MSGKRPARGEIRGDRSGIRGRPAGAARVRAATYNRPVSPDDARRAGETQPRPARKTAARGRRGRLQEPPQGTWLELAEPPPEEDATLGMGIEAADETPDDTSPRIATLPDEPDWLTEAIDAGTEETTTGVIDPEAAAAALAARREARGRELVGHLNEEQACAVTTTDGPLLILAGAGSGKTRVIAHRIAYLIGAKGINPRRILAVTFTNRAAGELRERIVALTGETGRDVEAGTFHSLNARVLRRDGDAIGLDRRFVIYDTDDQQQLMKRILAEEDLPATGEFRPSAVLGAISRAKNEMLALDEIGEHATTYRERTIAHLARAYEQRLRVANALDFDDLLLKAVELFE